MKQFNTFKPNYAVAFALIEALQASRNIQLSAKVVRVAERIVHNR